MPPQNYPQGSQGQGSDKKKVGFMTKMKGIEKDFYPINFFHSWF